MPDDKADTSSPAATPPGRKAVPPFEALRAFDAVARLQGVRKAALSLGRDHAVISRHLRTLEAWTGCKLTQRTSAGVFLTEDGLRYHRQIAQAIDIIARATTDLMKRSDLHRLQIWCMPGFALHWLSGRLGAFEKAHPGVEVELRPTDRSPDFSTHESDVDIRFVPAYGVPFQLAAGQKSVEVARAAIIAVASPAYLGQAGPIREPLDLLRHHLLHEDDFSSWVNWLEAHDVFDDVELTGPKLWQGHLTLDAARHGQGVALANKLVAAEDLASGRLVDVGAGNPAFQPEAIGIYLLMTRSDRWDAPLVRRFRSWLLAAVAKELPHLRAEATA